MKLQLFPDLHTGIKWVDSRWFVRFLEIFPGAVTWLTLILPIVLSLVLPVWVAYFIIGFDLYWMVKSFRLSINLVRGYRQLHLAQRVDWRARLATLDDPARSLQEARVVLDAFTAAHPEATGWQWWRARAARRHLQVLRDDCSMLSRLEGRTDLLKGSEVYQAVILATYNESIDILDPSVRSLTEVDFPLEQIIFVLAYEERGGPQTEANAKEIMARYGDKFGMAMAVKHPDGIVGEHRGKGGNISFAGRRLAEMVKERGIDLDKVVVTTFDADHRPADNYFSSLTYIYATEINRIHKSYQPIPMFYNNIWDVPAPMRVIATGNSFWLLMETMRPHRLRNFASHAQPLTALIKTNFWSVHSIVEDGHQFWRSYFVFEGDYSVVPVFTSVYQDAVLAQTYLKTFKVQFLQLRRWAWGVSDFSYVMRLSIAHKEIPWSKKLPQIGRLFESHFSWATAPLLITFVAWLPLYLNRQFSYQSLAHNLPIITSRIQTLASVTIVIMIYVSLIMLPPRPARYRRTRFIGMLLQWFLLPVTSLAFSALAAINAQTRIMFGRYIGFYTTEKATKK